MNKSESIKELATALSKAQGEIENAVKNAKNPHFKSDYADLSELLNTVRPVFSKNGLSVIQSPSYELGIVNLETTVAHSSGEWVSGICSAPVGKQDAQGVGSAITYLRRYSLAAFAGIHQEDDDGNASIKPAPQANAHRTVPAKQGISDDRFAKALQSIRDGKTTSASVRSHFELTAEQDNALHALDKELSQ